MLFVTRPGSPDAVSVYYNIAPLPTVLRTLIAVAVTLMGNWPNWSLNLILIVVAMALGPQIFGHTSINGLLRIGGLVRRNAYSPEPVGAGLLAGIFLLNGRVYLFYAGAGVVLGGVLWTIQFKKPS